MNIAYLNSQKCDNLNVISLYNPSFLYGINCFEGIRAYYTQQSGMRFFDLNEHIDRLYQSAAAMNFEVSIKKQDLLDELLNIIKVENIAENIYIRVTFFIDGETSWSTKNDVSYLISMRSMDSQLKDAKPISLAISTFRRISSVSVPPSVKAGANYLNSRYALLEANQKGYDGALFLSHIGYISESTGSCIFFIKDGALYTPSIDCDILVGVTRNRLISIAREQNIVVHEAQLPASSIHMFDAAFLAGTMIEIKAIDKIESKSYDTSNVTFEKLKSAFLNYIENEPSI